MPTLTPRQRAQLEAACPDPANLDAVLAIIDEVAPGEPPDYPGLAALTRGQLQAIFDGMALGVVVLDREQAVRLLNRATANFFRTVLGHAILVGDHLVDFLATQDQAAFQAHFRRALSGEAVEVTVRLQTPEGDTRYVDLHYSPLLSPGGGIEGVWLIVQDVTMRRRAIEALQDMEARYRQNFEHDEIIKLLVDPATGHIIDANRAAVRFYGYEHAHLTQMHIAEITVFDAAGPAATGPDVEPRNTHDFSFFRHRLASGTVRDVEVYSEPLKMHGRDLLYAIVFDVTERQRMALEREELIHELNDFAHSVAHDLKNPLHVITGSADTLLKTSALEAEDRQLVELMARTAYRMNGIVNEMLRLAQTRRTDDITIVPLDMASHVHEAMQRLPALAELGERLVLPESWPIALGYGPWIEEVWANYLSNAVKYGGETGRIALGGADQGDGTVRFWVTDNGPGLTAEQQAQLFQPFTRVEREGTEGHGLGLSIVKRIVDRLKGSVGVDSAPGQGSTFYFVLPAPGQTAAQPKAPEHDNGHITGP